MSFFKRLNWGAARVERNHPANEQDAVPGLVQALLADRKSERRASIIRTTLYVVMVTAPALLFMPNLFSGWSFSSGPVVGVVHLDGPIEAGAPASADRVLPALRRAFEAENVRAVVLSIDSPGGAPIESERINDVVAELRRKNPKPFVAVINTLGTSAAYLVAMHADTIYAGRYSIVGSIGAVMEGWDVHQVLAKYDVSRRVYASGELKSMLNPYIPMSDKADAEARELVVGMGKRFNEEMRAKRGNKLKPGIDYGSGGVWPGPTAKEIGVVDELGTLDSVVAKRWNLPIKDFGPREHGMPFVATASEWLTGVVSQTTLRLQANVDGVKFR
jgi:protease-4